MILAGDIGGTKANMGMFDVEDGKLVRVAHKRYVSHEHAGVEDIATDFVKLAGGKVTAAAFGVAGAVLNNRVHTANLAVDRRWRFAGAAARLAECEPAQRSPKPRATASS